MSADKAIRALRLDEGFRGRPYVCTGGAQTIGYGRNLDANPLTEQEGEYLLRRDVIACVKDLHTLIPLDIWEIMGAWRRAALINMRYQLGPSGLRSFRKLLMAINEQDWQWAGAEAANSRWADQTPNRAERVVRALVEDVDAWGISTT